MEWVWLISALILFGGAVFTGVDFGTQFVIYRWGAAEKFGKRKTIPPRLKPNFLWRIGLLGLAVSFAGGTKFILASLFTVIFSPVFGLIGFWAGSTITLFECWNHRWLDKKSGPDYRKMNKRMRKR